TIVMPRCRTIAIQPFYGDATEDCAMQSGRVAPVDNSRKEERKRERRRGRKRRKGKSLDHGVKGLRAAYFMRLRRTY
ncbi:hypothetical protein ACJ8L8_03540, partial [Bifidobacterium bifidum]|uniref:hypothetical protein n=1 Tax=Bifidobacterium bifidum TaxID=1681 RepID=UPI003B9C2E51